VYTGFSSVKLNGKRSFEKPTRRWEGDIQVDLIKIGWEGMDWIHPDDRDQWRILVNLPVP
jgi:hypothetical protein